MVTALGGALIRHESGMWCWPDGTPEPRVRDMLLRDLVPSWRCITIGDPPVTYVEIPRDWRHDVADRHARVVLESLIERHGQPTDIYAEAIAEAVDYHRVYIAGYRVPYEAWRQAMHAVVGVWWDKDDEADILLRADEVRPHV